MSSKANKFAAMATPIKSKEEISQKTTMMFQSIVESDTPDYQYLNLDAIQYNKDNDYADKDTEQDIHELAEDIKMNGLLHNIVVSYTEKGEYRLLSGERRVRAFHYLFDTTNDEKYSKIYALIRHGLTPEDEILILDAANLQTRGGIDGEKKFRKATARFIENVQKRLGIDNETAIALTKKYTDSTDYMIAGNYTLEKDLNKQLLALLDEGVLSKRQCLEYVKLSKDIQQSIAAALLVARQKGEQEYKKATNDTFDKALSIQETTERKKSLEKNLTDVSEEIKKADTSIQNSPDAKRKKEISAYKDRMLTQKAELQKRLTETQKTENKQRKELSANKEDSNRSSVNKESVLKIIDKIDKNIKNFETPKTNILLKSLTTQEKRDIIKSLNGLIDRISTVANSVELKK